MVYILELLKFSLNKEALKNLEIVLSTLQKCEMYACRNKYDFIKDNLYFLGLIIWKNGIQMNP